MTPQRKIAINNKEMNCIYLQKISIAFIYLISHYHLNIPWFVLLFFFWGGGHLQFMLNNLAALCEGPGIKILNLPDSLEECTSFACGCAGTVTLLPPSRPASTVKMRLLGRLVMYWRNYLSGGVGWDGNTLILLTALIQTLIRSRKMEHRSMIFFFFQLSLITYQGWIWILSQWRQ